jgi:hypothetical protein
VTGASARFIHASVTVEPPAHHAERSAPKVFAAICRVVVAAFAAAAQAQQAPVPNEKVLGTVLDFAAESPGPYQSGHLDFWRWPAEQRQRAASLSRLEIVADPNSGRKLLRVQVLDQAVFTSGSIPVLLLAPFLPPEADALRMHVRVVSGQLRSYVGGPTAYYANSDVFTATKQLAASGQPQSGVLEFNLYHPLWRNYRRSGFSTDAERNYYNRWAQESVQMHLAPGTSGEFLIEKIEAVSFGKSRPFPQFAPTDVRMVKKIADFEDGRRDGVFNVYMADAEVEWFEESWKRTKPLRFTPAAISVADDADRKAKTLVSTGPVAEEVHCTGIRTIGAPAANALRLTLMHDAPGYRNTVVGLGPAEVVDFLVFVAPPGKPFPWKEFEPSAELRSHPGPGFDYQLSYRLIRERKDVDFAIYQTRRYLRAKEWTTLVLPTADFVCVYGSGAYRDRYLRNEPLTCGEVMAVAWLNPWCRNGQRQSAVTTRIDELAFVQVPGRPEGLRSFWQIDNQTSVRWIDGTSPRGRIRHMLLPGDEPPVMEEPRRP